MKTLCATMSRFAAAPTQRASAFALATTFEREVAELFSPLFLTPVLLLFLVALDVADVHGGGLQELGLVLDHLQDHLLGLGIGRLVREVWNYRHSLFCQLGRQPLQKNPNPKAF